MRAEEIDDFHLEHRGDLFQPVQRRRRTAPQHEEHLGATHASAIRNVADGDAPPPRALADVGRDEGMKCAHRRGTLGARYVSSIRYFAHLHAAGEKGGGGDVREGQARERTVQRRDDEPDVEPEATALAIELSDLASDIAPVAPSRAKRVLWRAARLKGRLAKVGADDEANGPASGFYARLRRSSAWTRG